MAEIRNKKKISELPDIGQESLSGFYTIGYKEEVPEGETEAVPVSKKCSLAFVQTAANAANTAAALANTKAGLADTAATSANAAAAEASSAAAEASEVAESAEQAETARATAETARSQAEIARASAESARSAAETERGTAETARATSEASRVSAETSRASAEASRAEAETARVSSEGERSTAETARATAESNRVTKEEERVAAETARGTAENNRANAETLRASAETNRANAEISRASAETERDEAETARASAETARATAEEARVTAETNRGTAEQARATAESSRVTTETARASAETSRASAETARAEDESVRQSKEAGRQSAETGRQSAETERSAAEQTRASNETARGTAETARGNAETARASSETERASAESSRASAETARASAETGRVNAESARATAETSRASAEASRVSAETARVTAESLRNNAISGVDDLPVFNATTRYLAGTYCVHNNYVYRFTSTHEIGAWTGNDVVQTSVFGELKEMVVGDTEQVHVNISSSDGELEVEGLEVEVTFDDGSATQMVAVDEDGDCTIEIAKNKVYTLSVADQTGYQHCASFKSKANSNQRYVYFTYEKNISGETCTVTVSLVPSGGRTGAESQFVGKTVNLILSNGTSRSTTTDANGVATFENVTKGLTGTTANPKVTGFVTPAALSFSTNYSTIGLTATYAAMTAPGIWMVRSDGEEFDYYSWDESDTLVAIHVATQALADAGKDYYIPVDELTAAWYTSAHNKQWATSNVNFPNVPNWSSSTPNYNGPDATQKMMSDAATLGINSPAAEFAVETYFTLKGQTAQGYIGTRDQWQPLVDNSDMVSQMLTLGGKTSAWKAKNIWTSSQYSATGAWFWLSGSWNGSYSYKGSTGAVVPFFAI